MNAIRPIRTLVIIGGLACILGGALAGCVPGAVNTEQPNALVATPRGLTITSVTDTAHSSVALTCGCRFQLTDTTYTGDTQAILYHFTEPTSTMETPHPVVFYSAKNLPAGQHYQTKLALHVHDDNNVDLYDTITVSLATP